MHSTLKLKHSTLLLTYKCWNAAYYKMNGKYSVIVFYGRCSHNATDHRMSLYGVEELCNLFIQCMNMMESVHMYFSLVYMDQIICVTNHLLISLQLVISSLLIITHFIWSVSDLSSGYALRKRLSNEMFIKMTNVIIK